MELIKMYFYLLFGADGVRAGVCFRVEAAPSCDCVRAGRRFVCVCVIVIIIII